MDRINRSIAKFQYIFKMKLATLIILRKDCDRLNNILVKILNNIQNNFLIRRINSNELRKLTNDINKIYDKYDNIYTTLKIRFLETDKFKILNKNIIDYEIEIKQFLKVMCIGSLYQLLSIVISPIWKTSILDKQYMNILFYDGIFVCCNIKIESKYNYLKDIQFLKDGDIFIKKLSKRNNIVEELHGAILHLYIYEKVFIIEGYFKSDNLNIIKNNCRYKNKLSKLYKLIKIEAICKDFSKKYIEQISLRDFVVSSINELSDQISVAYEKLHFYKDMSLTEILLTFNTSSLDRQREMLTILILSDSKSGNLAGLLYDVVLKKDSPIKARQLYLSLHTSVQKRFDIVLKDFNEEIQKLKKISINDISYDKKITMCRADENSKLKALEKYKQLKGSNVFGSSSNDTKVETWLNGFLKIPFNIIRNNEIISFIDSYPIKLYELIKLLIKKYDIDKLKIVNENNYKKSSMINKLVLILGKLIIKDEFSDFYKNKASKIISKWNEYKFNRKVYIKEVRQILDGSVYGNIEAKEQIEKIIGQWINGKMTGGVIGLQGPPGVGKTTIAKKGLSKCLKDNDGNPRPFAFLPLGGSTQGSFLVGHGYTYIGATWGRIVDILMEVKCMNPIIFIDELDKVSKTAHGNEIIGILTHLTDLTQNDEFTDKYFSGIKFDVSKCLFIFSYNNSNLIDPILRDRITEINLKPLTTKDKIIVVKDYLLPEILECVGLDKSDIIFSDESIIHLIDTYTFEAGVRKLKEKILDIVRYINLQRIYEKYNDSEIIINKELIDKILEKKPKINFKKIPSKPLIGYINGLFATSSGIGGITIIEVVKSFSDQKLGMTLTGSQGDVMQESMKCAKTIAWNIIPTNIKEKIKKDWEDNGNWGLHIHTPDTATPKDGPSAGGAITLGIISRLTGVPIVNTIATTGEIDLNGNIKKIGGLCSKILGAHKAGVKKIYIPEENKDDLELIKKDNLLPDVTVVLIKHISELVKEGLVGNDLEFNFKNI
jgi:hypothetical protein